MLPEHLWDRVFRSLDPCSTARAAATCRVFRAMVPRSVVPPPAYDSVVAGMYVIAQKQCETPGMFLYDGVILPYVCSELYTLYWRDESVVVRRTDLARRPGCVKHANHRYLKECVWCMAHPFDGQPQRVLGVNRRALMSGDENAIMKEARHVARQTISLMA